VATAFTNEEKEKIHRDLISAAMDMAAKYGMKKTSVDQLAERVGISKGMFYKFYPTKEMLFFEMLEHMHSTVYGRAEEVLQNRLDLNEKERLAEAFLVAISIMDDMGMMDFFESEIQFLLRKIPDDVLKKHYHSDMHHIKELMEISGFRISLPADIVSALVRALMLTISHRTQIGDCYTEVLKILVYSVCDRIIDS